MAIQLDVQNFKVLKSVRLHDDSNFSVVLGYNNTGKTSLIAAMQFALTGAALGHRGKEAKRFVTHGEERMAVRVKIGTNLFCRTQSTGDEIKSVAERLCVPTDVLPLLFDAKLNGDGGCKAMKVFLDTCATSSFDASIYFANDPKVKPAIEQARRAGKLSTKHIIDYCEAMRAAQKTPAEPIMPTSPRPTDEELNGLMKDNDQAQTEWRSKVRETQDAIKTGMELAEIVNYFKAMEAYEKTKATASLVDPLKEKRDPLTKLVNANVNSVKALAQILMGAGYVDASCKVVNTIADIELAIRGAKVMLLQYPLPIPLPEPPILSAGAKATYDSLLDGGITTQQQFHELLRSSTDITNACRTAEQEALSIKQQMQLIYDEAQRLRGAWDAYNDQLPLWDDAKAKAGAEWERWDFAGKAITQAEIDHVNKAGNAFGEMVSEFSAYILNGKKVKISRDEGIFVGVDPIEECSESTRWRVEVAIMASVARTLKSPLLLIDGADILDVKNRNLISQFLKERIVPYFDHVIITATPRGLLEEEKPIPEATKWILREGGIQKLEAAS